MVVVVRNRDEVRPPIDVCDICYQWYLLYISPLSSWRVFADKWNSDPIYKAKVVRGMKHQNEGTVPNYKRSEVGEFARNQTSGGRTWIILNKKEMQPAANKKYLKTDEMIGVPMMVPKELWGRRRDGLGVPETSTAFWDD